MRWHLINWQLTPKQTNPEGKVSLHRTPKLDKKVIKILVAVVARPSPQTTPTAPRKFSEVWQSIKRSLIILNPGNPSEVVIADDGGGLQSKAIADDLVQSGQVLAVIVHGNRPF